MRGQGPSRIFGAVLLGLALGGAGSLPPAGAFEVYCVAAGVNTLSCQRLDTLDSKQTVLCVDSLADTRSCSFPDGKVRTCVRSRGNVFSCEKPSEGAPERSRCQLTGRGVYDCQHAPGRLKPSLPLEGPDEDLDPPFEEDLDSDLILHGLED